MSTRVLRCSLCDHKETTQERRRREHQCLRCGAEVEYVSWVSFGLPGLGQQHGYYRSLCEKHLAEAREKMRARKAAKLLGHNVETRETPRPETDANTPQAWDKA